MLAQNLQKAVIKRGGTCDIIERSHCPGLYELSGILNGHDVHAYLSPDWQTGKLSSGHFTTRPIKMRGYFDPGADYDTGGHTFCDKIKDLDWACRQ